MHPISAPPRLTALLRRAVLRPCRGAFVVLALLMLAAGPAPAMVDDSHSAAMEAATPAVKEGFKVRQEYKSGTVKSGAKTAVKYQLFKGNEYWFWLGTSNENVKLTLDAYDAKGNKVTVETKSSGDSASVRILPPKTGTYYLVFTLTGSDGEEIDWALAYGYR